MNPKNFILMKIAIIIARSLLGLIFAVFGSNAFLHFIPMPPMHGPGGDFIGAMYQTGYLYVVAACEVLGGLILLSGRFIPLGLTLLGPVIVNILCFHIFMDHAGLPLALIVAALALFLLWQNRSAFTGLLKA
jgi:uncharacterized membrane protein YphA (DoxX/SURF4 family)